LRQRKAGRAGQRQHQENSRTHRDSLEHLTDPETTPAILTHSSGT
jgi:hypothetical protein